jgi:hypothetical protein
VFFGGDPLPPHAVNMVNAAKATAARRRRGAMIHIVSSAKTAAGQSHLRREFVGAMAVDRGVVVTTSSELFWIEQLPAGIWQEAVRVGIDGKLLKVICAVTIPPPLAVSAGGVAVTAGAEPRRATVTGLRLEVMVRVPVTFPPAVGVKVTVTLH